MISWEKEKRMRISLNSNRLRNVIHMENNQDIFMKIGININDNEENKREDIDIFYDLINIWEKLNNDKIELRYKINNQFEIKLCE